MKEYKLMSRKEMDGKKIETRLGNEMKINWLKYTERWDDEGKKKN